MCTLEVVNTLLFLSMLTAIKFDSKLYRSTIKIQDIVKHGFLPTKANRICPQEIIPQMTFFLRHLMSQRLCFGDKIITVMKHAYSPIAKKSRTPLPPFGHLPLGGRLSCLRSSEMNT